MQTTQQNNEARTAIKSGFAWDGQDAYLFDIDGTLLRSRDRVHMDSLPATVREVMGLEVSLQGVSLAGNTDTSILREACALAGPILMPGVEETLKHLADRGATLGVATGNLEMIGWIKVERAGLREWFRFGGFSDHFPVRSELVGHAAKKARELAGAEASICVVGDTPRDIEAAHANGLAVIAVATGHFSFEELLEHGPEVCTTTLADLLAATRGKA